MVRLQCSSAFSIARGVHCSILKTIYFATALFFSKQQPITTCNNWYMPTHEYMSIANVFVAFIFPQIAALTQD